MYATLLAYVPDNDNPVPVAIAATVALLVWSAVTWIRDARRTDREARARMAHRKGGAL